VSVNIIFLERFIIKVNLIQHQVIPDIPLSSGGLYNLISSCYVKLEELNLFEMINANLQKGNNHSHHVTPCSRIRANL